MGKLKSQFHVDDNLSPDLGDGLVDDAALLNPIGRGDAAPEGLSDALDAIGKFPVGCWNWRGAFLPLGEKRQVVHQESQLLSCHHADRGLQKLFYGNRIETHDASFLLVEQCDKRRFLLVSWSC